MEYKKLSFNGEHLAGAVAEGAVAAGQRDRALLAYTKDCLSAPAP